MNVEIVACTFNKALALHLRYTKHEVGVHPHMTNARSLEMTSDFSMCVIFFGLFEVGNVEIQQKYLGERGVIIPSTPEKSLEFCS